MKKIFWLPTFMAILIQVFLSFVDYQRHSIEFFKSFFNTIIIITPFLFIYFIHLLKSFKFTLAKVLGRIYFSVMIGLVVVILDKYGGNYQLQEVGKGVLILTPFILFQFFNELKLEQKNINWKFKKIKS